MVEQQDFQLVIASVHPQIDAQQFATIIGNPERYSQFLATACSSTVVNIVAHPGFGCVLPEDRQPVDEGKMSRTEAEYRYRDQIDWPTLTKAALENDVALEINLKDLFSYIYRNIVVAPESENASNWKAELQAKLPELIPIVGSDKILTELTPYFQQGLKVAINLDEHRNPFIGHDYFHGEVEAVAGGRERPSSLKFWRAMVMVYDYTEQRLTAAGLTSSQVINSYSTKQLSQFLAKQEISTVQPLINNHEQYIQHE